MEKLPCLFGRYYLLDRIALGGMAEIFKAKTRGIGGFEKILAIKRLHHRLSEDKDFINMLIDEANISVQLSHINICQIFDLDQVESTYFIAMEYIDGRDLSRVIRACEEQGIPFPLDGAAFIAHEICAGLDYAHRKRDMDDVPLNIVHRDISPQNILISFEGEVKIVDFGIAKAASRIRETEAGIIKGKYFYMSPEQARGAPLDKRTDIFSTGVVLYETLTGVPAYLDEPGPALLMRVRRGDIPSVSTLRPEIPPALETLVMRSLMRDPRDRWQTASQLQMELNRFLYSVGSDFNKLKLARLMRRLFEHERADKPATRGGRMLNVDYQAEPSSLVRSALEDDLGESTHSGVDEVDVEACLAALAEEPVEPLEGEATVVAPSPFEEEDLDDAPTLHLMKSDTGTIRADDLIEEEEVDPETQVTIPVANPASRSKLPMPSAPPRPSRRLPAPAEEAVPWRKASARPIPAPDEENQGGVETVAESQGLSLPAMDRAKARPKTRSSAHNDPTVMGSLAELAPPKAQQAPLSRQKMLFVMILALDVLAAGVLGRGIDSLGLRRAGPDEVVRLRVEGPQAVVPEVVLTQEPQAVVIPPPSSPPAEVPSPLGALAVRSEPPGAAMLLNGEPVGITPMESPPLPPGSHQVELRLEGYMPLVKQVALAQGQRVELDEKLHPLTGMLKVQTEPPGALVSVNGEDRGASPVEVGGLALDKAVALKVTLKGYQAVEREVRFGDETSRMEEIVLTAEPKKAPAKARMASKPRRPQAKPTPQPVAEGGYGYLNVGATPWARVYIDGNQVGNTPLVKYRVKAGNHTVQVYYPSLNTYSESRRFLVQGGKVIPVYFSH